MPRWSQGSTVNRCHGFAMVELLVAVAITVFLTAVIFGLLAASQGAYQNAEAGIQLRNIFRQASPKMSWELSHTGYDGGGAAQFTISAGAGANGSDTIRFSVPVSCDASLSLLNTSGDPAHWGAYLTWGCDQTSCADSDGNCTTVEYKYIQYALNTNGQIIRSVLNATATNTVGTQIMAEKITALHFATSGTNALTFSFSGQIKSGVGRMLTDTMSQTVRLMN